jgi:hypothetical protein
MVMFRVVLWVKRDLKKPYKSTAQQAVAPFSASRVQEKVNDIILLVPLLLLTVH